MIPATGTTRALIEQWVEMLTEQRPEAWLFPSETGLTPLAGIDAVILVAAAGAAAGTAGAAATGKLEVGISAESLLTFPLRAALTHCLSKDRAHRKSDRVANNVCSLSRPVFEGSLLIRWRLRSTDATRPETAARRLCRGRK